MQVKNVKTGEVETLRHGPAVDAATAGTHEFVNVDEKGKPKEEKAKAKKPSEPAK
ncbi:hypothetical protein [Neorhizobium sp. DAR64872/K0K18]|uniref:hypothetical protein n=1 Tax=Neorhizobium sp. DAR64872/K0K18 TaxID=3421958 RepID=UPI003D271D7F